LRRYIPILCLIAAAAAAAACDEKLSSIAGPTPDLTPTFSSIQSDIFAARDSSGRPACISCHSANGRTPSAGLNLDGGPEVYDRIVGVAARLRAGETYIIPGNPDASYMVRKVEGGPNINGGRMPLNGPFLSAGQITILRRWIELGAPRN
jgi:mono/diheme cytochrome c family protein